MKKLLIVALAVISGGIFGTARGAEGPVPTSPAARTEALFESGGTVRVAQTYYHRRHRRFVGYRNYRVVYYRHGVRYVRYERRAVYVWR